MSSRSYDCPSCGAAVKFDSSIAVSAVCEHCRSIVVVRDTKAESLGTMAQLPPDLTPLQPGTRGEWRGQRFEIIGRLRVEWEEGSWNEWCAEFGDGRQGWIADAQGFCMVSFREDAVSLPPKADDLQPGRELEHGGRRWTMVDVKKVRCQSGEGQLPFEVTSEWRRTSVDLTSRDGKFGSLEYEEDGVAFYAGEYARYEELALENLRPVPGWSAEVEVTRNQSATLGCPGCGAAVNLRAAGQSMSAVCGSCGGVISTANPNLEIIQKAHERVRHLNPVLPIGKRGRLFDVEYEVIGFVVRKDPWCAWQEYLLFNPWHGFEWLVNFRGHWSFVRRVMGLGDMSGAKVYFERRAYDLFAMGKAKVSGVLGEFYWQVRRGEEAKLSDWVSPPNILSKEEYPGLQEFTWSHGTYVERAIIAEAFGVKDLPEPTGIYLNQPNPFDEKWKSARRLIGALLVAYVLIQFLFVFKAAKRPVFEGEFVFDRAQLEAAKVVTTPKFEIKGGPQPVWIKGGANVSNNWLGLDVDLVNARTNETVSAPISLEYYHGVADGEAWSEGSQGKTTSFAAIAPGEYFLNIETEADPAINHLPYRVVVEGGGLFWSNFWTGLLVLLIYPVYLRIRRHTFERARWMDSDYSPYASSSDDDD